MSSFATFDRRYGYFVARDCCAHTTHGGRLCREPVWFRGTFGLTTRACNCDLRTHEPREPKKKERP